MKIILIALTFLCSHNCIADYFLHTPKHPIQVQSWKQLRDQGIEKQDLDYSCGSAAVATILRAYYGFDVYEQDILTAVERIGNDGAASFADLQQAVQSFGFKAIGIAATFDMLKTIKIPALLYLQYRDQDHFSVLRGMSDTHILLADPSWGNRTFTRHQFKQLWEQDTLKGKALVIVPNSPIVAQANFFQPPHVNMTPIELLTHR